jgi:RNA polymerase subunit RPABC4/transcription elongation factor Spt4
MAIVTLCRSCDTVVRAVIDRCKYCGSRCVETKFISDSLILHTGKRDILIKVKQDGSKAHT